MTFSLAGLLLWRRGGVARVVAYPIAGLSLLSFETAYIAFLCAPLLLASRAEFRRLSAWVVHAAGCSIVVGLVVLARVVHGGWPNGARDVLGKPAEAATRAITSLYLGPLSDLHAFGHAVVEGGRHTDLWAIASTAVLALLLFAWHLRRPYGGADSGPDHSFMAGQLRAYAHRLSADPARGPDDLDSYGRRPARGPARRVRACRNRAQIADL
jgi:hypothetical protein